MERLLEVEKRLSMQDFTISIDEFLKLNRYNVLEGFGQMSQQKIKDKAFNAYEEFNKYQKIFSDFDQ